MYQQVTNNFPNRDLWQSVRHPQQPLRRIHDGPPLTTAVIAFVMAFLAWYRLAAGKIHVGMLLPSQQKGGGALEERLSGRLRGWRAGKGVLSGSYGLGKGGLCPLASRIALRRTCWKKPAASSAAVQSTAPSARKALIVASSTR